MTLTLLVALVSSQVVYEWVDAKGQSHFTDDRSTIPQGVKPREAKGGEVSVVPASTATVAEAADAGTDEEETRAEDGQAQDTCAVARSELARAEEQANTARQAQAQLEEDASLRCGNVLLTHGQGSFAQCMAGRAEAITRDDSALQQQVEAARESLRAAQSHGCR
jgi:hypothetical protein